MGEFAAVRRGRRPGPDSRVAKDRDFQDIQQDIAEALKVRKDNLISLNEAVRRKAIDPPDGVRTDLDVLAGLASRLGCATGFPTDPVAVYDELRRASAGGPSFCPALSGSRARW